MNYVVIASNDSSIIYTMKVILKEDFFVEEVKNVEELIEIMYKRQPSVIFIDIPFGECDPVEILEEVKRVNPYIPVVFLFPSFNACSRQCLEKGAYDVLEKPFNLDILLHKIHQAVEREKLILDKEKGNEKSGIKNNQGIPSSMENSLFQEVLQTIGTKFSDIKILSDEILKILRKNMYLSSQAIFLKNQDNEFIPVSSLGIDENVVSKFKLNWRNYLIRYLLSVNKVVDVHEEKTPAEVKKFARIFNCRYIFPLKSFGGKLMGFFITGEKINGEGLSCNEIYNLCFLFDYLLPVIENIFLYNEVKRQRSFTESVVENIPAGVIGIDREGRIFILNSTAKKILDLQQEELIGEKIEKVGSQITDYLRRTMEYGKNFEREEFNFIPKKKIIGISTNCLKDEKGEITGAVAIFQDLTYLKEIEKKEKEIEKSKYWTILASRLSHELKNPLVAINTFVQLLPEKYEEEEFRSEFSRIVRQEIKRLNDVVRKVTELAEKVEIAPRNVNLTKIIKNVTEKVIGKQIEIKGGEVFAEVDPEKFKDAIEYIAEFVKEDMKNGGDMRIELNKRENFTEILISENGKNWDFKSEEEILLSTSSNLQSPYSIGIILAKKIIEAHNGILKIEITPTEKTFKIAI